jgi:hypothetical protein
VKGYRTFRPELLVGDIGTTFRDEARGRGTNPSTPYRETPSV